MNEKLVTKIGWFAAAMAIVMFASYIDQIRLNVDGKPGSVILPLATMVNCFSWVLYGSLKKTKDLPIIVCNSLGFVIGLVTAITAIIFS